MENLISPCHNFLLTKIGGIRPWNRPTMINNCSHRDSIRCIQSRPLDKYQLRCHRSSSPCQPSGDVIVRQSVEYHPSVWGDYFITHTPLSSNQKSNEWIKERIEELKKEVQKMLLNEMDQLQEMRLIDALQRLGIDYHFEKEIDEVLNRVHDSPNDFDDLHVIALRFRLLRQQGYNTPSDVFAKFKDDNDNFKPSLCSDPRGLLSLYEAAYCGTHGENILDEAKAFASSHLKSMATHLELPLAMQVSHALTTPLVRRVRRLEARHYIFVYQDDKEIRNDKVLELAKLDFSLLQLLHQEEVRSLTKWWKELDFTTTLPFARDRLVECYFWMVGVHFEPHYSNSRIIITKVIALSSILDDVYDVFGTLEELEMLTDVIQRWELEAADQLPGYMKGLFLAFTNTFKGFEDELAEEEKYRVHYLKEAMKDVVKAYLEEAKWRTERYVPPLEEHMQVSLMSGAMAMLICASFVGMGEVATKDAFDWIMSYPKILMASSTIGRLMDDIVTHELEQEREHVASTVQCYMKEHGTTVQEASEKLQEIVEGAWKDMNKECLRPTPVSMPLLALSVNFARTVELLYKYYDGYTNSSGMIKDYITLMLVEPISI